jgi:hypothetical protein
MGAAADTASAVALRTGLAEGSRPAVGVQVEEARLHSAALAGRTLAAEMVLAIHTALAVRTVVRTEAVEHAPVEVVDYTVLVAVHLDEEDMVAVQAMAAGWDTVVEADSLRSAGCKDVETW